MNRILTLSLLTFALFGCAPREGEEPIVSATDAWCRPTVQGAGAAGCYVTLVSSARDRLTAADSPAGERVEIHTMSMDGGIMRMRELPDGLELPAGESVALRPGADHLMLMAPNRALNEGESLEITLRFQTAPAQTVQAQIRSAPHGAAH